jgi:hypothetical protein
MPNRRSETYTIHIEGKWSLEDLYVFPHTFEQVYFLVYSLDHEHDATALERLEHAYRAFRWQGGYSAANFYNELRYIMPKQDRPQIASIRYASPGWIELALVLSGAMGVERIVKSVAKSIDHTNDTYNNIIRGMSERKLLRLKVKRKELQFRAEELEFIDTCQKQMGKLMGFNNLSEINERTGNPYITLKILLSLYRRVRTLAKYQENGKVDFRNER